MEEAQQGKQIVDIKNKSINVIYENLPHEKCKFKARAYGFKAERASKGMSLTALRSLVQKSSVIILGIDPTETNGPHFSTL